MYEPLGRAHYTRAHPPLHALFRPKHKCLSVLAFSTLQPMTPSLAWYTEINLNPNNSQRNHVCAILS